jgi:hypothetical protein
MTTTTTTASDPTAEIVLARQLTGQPWTSAAALGDERLRAALDALVRRGFAETRSQQPYDAATRTWGPAATEMRLTRRGEQALLETALRLRRYIESHEEGIDGLAAKVGDERIETGEYETGEGGHRRPVRRPRAAVDPYLVGDAVTAHLAGVESAIWRDRR